MSSVCPALVPDSPAGSSSLADCRPQERSTTTTPTATDEGGRAADMLCSTETCTAGYYRAACTALLQGACVKCSNAKSEFAHYSGAGAPFDSNACPWACDDGYGVVERGICSLLGVEFYQPVKVTILFVGGSAEAFVEFQQETLVADMAAEIGTSDIIVISVTEMAAAARRASGEQEVDLQVETRVGSLTRPAAAVCEQLARQDGSFAKMGHSVIGCKLADGSQEGDAASTTPRGSEGEEEGTSKDASLQPWLIITLAAGLVSLLTCTVATTAVCLRTRQKAQDQVSVVEDTSLSASVGIFSGDLGGGVMPRPSITFQTLASPNSGLISRRAGDERMWGFPRAASSSKVVPFSGDIAEPVHSSAPTAARRGSKGRRGSAGSMAIINETSSSEHTPAGSGETSPEMAAAVWNPVGFAKRRLGIGRLPPRGRDVSSAAGAGLRVVSVNSPLPASSSHLQWGAPPSPPPRQGAAGGGAGGGGTAGAAGGGAPRPETPSLLAWARSSPMLEAVLTPQSWHLTTPVARRQAARVAPAPYLDPFSPQTPQSARLPETPGSALPAPSPPPRADGRKGKPDVKQAWLC